MIGNRRHNARRQILATIDMTPIMDLTFMLLIIFVITVPSMYYKSDVKLTPPSADTNVKMEPDQKSVFVELDSTGAIWLGEANHAKSTRMLSTEELTTILAERKEATPDLLVYLVGDRERQYAEVVDIANAIQHAGIDQLSLVFQPEKNGK